MADAWRIGVTFFTSFVLTFFLLPKLSHIASKVGLVDQPDGRKVHQDPKPLVGGIGMIMSLSLTCLVFVPLTNLRGFYAAVTMLVIVGFLDDFRELNHRVRFLAQISSVIFLMYLSDIVLLSFGNLLAFGNINFGGLSVFVTVFCVVGVINALNMIDGLDGLAGGVSLVAFLSFAFLSYYNGQQVLMLLSLAFCGGLVAFLRYNWPPASLFMGDAGSMVIGFSLAFFSIAVTQGEGSRVPPVAPLLILAVPIVDTLVLMTRRAIWGKSPFHPDKNHLHHILLRFGFSTKSTVGIVVFLTSSFSLLAILGTVQRIREYYLFSVFAVYFALIILVSVRLRQIYKALLRRNRFHLNQIKSLDVK